MGINQLIEINNLQPADAVELVSREAGFPKHYAIYLGNEKGNPQFIANVTNGVQVINSHALNDFAAKYEVVAIERFNGGIRERKKVVRKALSKLGEKAYNIIFNNCEHFKNWVLYGISSSKQVEKTGRALLVGGTALTIVGLISNRNGLAKMGLYILLLLFTLIAIAGYLYKQNQNEKG
jgi:hypothetical protein